MKRILILCLIFVPVFSKAQTEKTDEDKGKTSKIKLVEASTFIGINGGIDFNMNAFREAPSVYYPEVVFSGIQPHYNIGFDISFLFPFRIRPRLEFKYVRASYKMEWNNTNATFDKTITRLNYADINLHIDYLLLAGQKFQVYLSPGFKSEYILSSKNDRYQTDGEHDDVTYNGIGKEYPNSILAVAFSAILKYNITKEIGITFIPEYTYFGRDFVLSNKNRYQRLSANVGIEFGF